MCGIAGSLQSGTESDLVAVTASMMQAFHHRGPDAGDVWVDQDAGIALGHRRLSILDLSPAGAQPMHSSCGRWVLVFNGEIYNFQSLRKDLEALGAAFRGHSDTEVLLAGVVHWGLEETLRRANGMFAIGLWDRAERKLHLARDRFGEKPLYYGWHGGVFLFASELKAFHAWRGFKPTVNRAALPLYLRHNYIPEPHSIYEGILKLVPGTVLSISATERNQYPEPRPFFSLTQLIAHGRSNPVQGSPEDGVHLLEQALSHSVGLRMVADVPLGAFLSGGIDSSTVVALMQAQSTRPIKTFSIGFTEAGYDEAPHARAVARHLGTEHSELYVTPEEARAVIPLLPEMYDEPFADSSQIPTYLVSKLARQQVTVAMSGDAGDELFAGYSRYSIGADLWRRQSSLPHPLRKALAGLLTTVAPRHWDRIFSLLGPVLPAKLRQPMAGDKLHKFAGLLGIDDPMAMYLQLISLWKHPLEVVPGMTDTSDIVARAAALPASLNTVERMMAIDAAHYLPGDILTKVDRASMAVSLEARVPLLDNEVVELAWRMPYAWKVRNGQGKWVLREVLAKHVPREIFERPKMGFGVPIDAWLRGPLKSWAEELLSEERLRRAGYFDPAPIRTAWKAHLAGGQNLQYQLWGVLCFEAWRERWGH
ncbi:MAG: asparagine synthase (glutamine-hydrolyzing) [Gammaproteobacteria bacterium]|nr:asparagine synthase (glutamine-hydrolyzing) [Gammaproteobacteria bacterium]